ncbi:MAG: zf-HC2 domain-containing protein [Gammaproteobacteria bacterium]|nr:zf-HC2 domain-containing protein [Gammaproteobacteria bacterium]
MMNCKQATQLMSQSQDRPLSRRERISIRLHLLICSGCKNYNKQLTLISKSIKQLKDRI